MDIDPWHIHAFHLANGRRMVDDPRDFFNGCAFPTFELFFSFGFLVFGGRFWGGGGGRGTGEIAYAGSWAGPCAGCSLLVLFESYNLVCSRRPR